MNRVEYMTRLASMLQDIPVEERQEAMKYYNDYFDEAGEENEEKVAAELDSPEKVAAVIKAEIYGRNNTGETKAPVYPAEKEEKDTNNWWKILLIIVGGLFVLSIAGPIVLGVALTVLAVVVSVVIALIAFVIAAGCLAIVGIALFIGGLTQIAVALPEAFTLIGSGMILFAVGMVGVVLLVQLCFVAFPKMFRWIVKICKKPFHRKAVS